MSPKEATQALAKIREAAHADYPQNGARLQQLDSALATAAMAFEHLADEDVRERDLVARLRRDRKQFDAHAHQVRGGADSIFQEAS